jgi:hypothetical protein
MALVASALSTLVQLVLDDGYGRIADRASAHFADLERVRVLGSVLDGRLAASGYTGGAFDARALRAWLNSPEVRLALGHHSPSALSDLWEELRETYRFSYVSPPEEVMRELAEVAHLAVLLSVSPEHAAILQALRLSDDMASRVAELDEVVRALSSVYETDAATWASYLPDAFTNLQAGVDHLIGLEETRRDLVTPIDYSRIEASYRAHHADILDRGDELNAVAEMLRRPDGPQVVIVEAEPFAGKTAFAVLLAEALRRSGITVIAFFVAEGEQDTAADFSLSVISQLCRTLGQPPIIPADVSSRIGALHMNFARFAQACDEAERLGVLIVDGLDEEAVGPPRISGVIPSAVGAFTRIVVLTRPRPDWAPRGTVAHRLQLPASAHATIDDSELRAAVATMMGVDHGEPVATALSIARSPISFADLGDLCAITQAEVRSVLAPATRHLRLDVSRSQSVRITFGHIEYPRRILTEAGAAGAARALDEFERWSWRWANAGWPDATPHFLTDDYLHSLRSHSSWDSAVALVADRAWLHRVALRHGSDVVIHGQIRETQSSIAATRPLDLVSCALLAAVRHEIAVEPAAAPMNALCAFVQCGRYELADTIHRSHTAGNEPSLVLAAQLLDADPDRAFATLSEAALSVTRHEIGPFVDADAGRTIECLMTAETTDERRGMWDPMSTVLERLLASNPQRADQLLDRLPFERARAVVGLLAFEHGTDGDYTIGDRWLGRYAEQLAEIPEHDLDPLSRAFTIHAVSDRLEERLRRADPELRRTMLADGAGYHRDDDWAQRCFFELAELLARDRTSTPGAPLLAASHRRTPDDCGRFLDISGGNERPSLVGILIRGLCARYPEEALNIARAHSNRNELLADIAGELMDCDAPLARSILDELPESRRRDDALTRMAISDLVASPERLLAELQSGAQVPPGVVATATIAQLDSSPNLAADLLAHLPSGSARADVLAAMAVQSVSVDPHNAFEHAIESTRCVDRNLEARLQVGLTYGRSLLSGSTGRRDLLRSVAQAGLATPIHRRGHMEWVGAQVTAVEAAIASASDWPSEAQELARATWADMARTMPMYAWHPVLTRCSRLLALVGDADLPTLISEIDNPSARSQFALAAARESAGPLRETLADLARAELDDSAVQQPDDGEHQFALASAWSHVEPETALRLFDEGFGKAAQLYTGPEDAYSILRRSLTGFAYARAVSVLATLDLDQAVERAMNAPHDRLRSESCLGLAVGGAVGDIDLFERLSAAISDTTWWGTDLDLRRYKDLRLQVRRAELTSASTRTFLQLLSDVQVGLIGPQTQHLTIDLCESATASAPEAALQALHVHLSQYGFADAPRSVPLLYLLAPDAFLALAERWWPSDQRPTPQ